MFEQFFSQISFVDVFNICIFILFTICYAYQIFYVFVVLFKKPPVRVANKNHKYAVVISARNEEAVISNLIHSIKAQNYPQELIDVFVVADNCTDNTAKVAEQAGATVFTRNDSKKVGKGYGLDFAYTNIMEEYSDKKYEAFFVFDADNILDANYFREMNATFDSGAQVSTSYRNSKNFDSNWISAGYAIWFLREAKYLNQARISLDTSCTISGTGFYVSADLLKRHGGWIWHLLTEDVEFSAQNIIEGERISYTPSAIFYDEQPVTFKDSWHQRFRWAKGFYQVLMHYGARLVKHSFKNAPGKRFACYDMLMTIAPGAILTIISLTFNATILVLAIIGWMPPDIMVWSAFTSVCFCFLSYLSFMFVFGALTTASEWKNIRATSAKKILYMFTFPVFMLTYVPIALVALVKKAEWKQVSHTISVNIEDFMEDREQKAQTRKAKSKPQKAFFE